MLGPIMLPPVSLPIANATNPAAVEAPGPALDPDDPSSSSHVFIVCPQTKCHSEPKPPGSASQPAPRPQRSAASPPRHHPSALDFDTAPRHTLRSEEHT